jgi:uncharacterized small protein (DUF1192 family)
MSQPPDIEALARRYLDLWQDQASALAGDAELARQLGRWLTLMQSGMAHAFQEAATTSAPGSQTPAAASGGGQSGLDELARRLALLEERIAGLEAGAGRKRKPAGRRARRSGS